MTPRLHILLYFEEAVKIPQHNDLAGCFVSLCYGHICSWGVVLAIELLFICLLVVSTPFPHFRLLSVSICLGIGIAVTVNAFITEIPYATVIAWSLRYFYASFSNVLPWTTCGNSWNTPNCYAFSNSGSVLTNNSALNWTVASTFNVSNATSSVEEFWE